MHNFKSLRGSILLLLTALIWGSAFVAQSVGNEYMQPVTFNCIRSILGGLVLLPIVFIISRTEKKGKNAVQPTKEEKRCSDRNLLIGGLCCGAILFTASTLQQIGINYTTAGKAGFITALYIVLVPIAGLLFGKRPRFTVWAGVVIAAVGLYLLSIKEDFSIGFGDLLVLLCAVCFTAHILVIGHFSPLCDGIKMSCIQLLTSGALGIIPMFLFEQPNISAIASGWFPIVYAGVMSCGIAYTLQIVAQRDVNETVASLLMSLESVFAALTGLIILNERLSLRELCGCVLIFGAVILAQLPPTKLKLPIKKRGAVH